MNMHHENMGKSDELHLFNRRIFLSDLQIYFMIGIQVLCGITQFFFLTLEAAEIKHTGFAGYFRDGWNYFDSTQGLLYTV